MTHPPLMQIEHVYHVGSLDIATRTDRPSLEGPCLSVSKHPEEWGFIARIAGTVWDLTRVGALWFDATGVDDALAAEIRTWALEEGLAEEARSMEIVVL